MTRKKMAIGAIAAVIIVFALVITTYLLHCPQLLGSMNHRYAEQTTTVSDITFSGNAGDRIKFSFRSDVKDGELDMVLYASDGSIAYELDRAKALETFFTLDNSDTYTLAAECQDFIGNYKISVYLNT